MRNLSNEEVEQRICQLAHDVSDGDYRGLEVFVETASPARPGKFITPFHSWFKAVKTHLGDWPADFKAREFPKLDIAGMSNRDLVISAKHVNATLGYLDSLNATGPAVHLIVALESYLFREVLTRLWAFAQPAPEVVSNEELCA